MDGWIYPLCTSTAAKAVTLAMVQRGQGAWILQIVSRETMLVPLFLLTAAWHIYNLKHVFFSECAVCFFHQFLPCSFFPSGYPHETMIIWFINHPIFTMVSLLKTWFKLWSREFHLAAGKLLSGYFTYPLVNQHPWKITILHGKIHYKWWFSIVMLNSQRVT